MTILVMGSTGKVGRALRRYWTDVSVPSFDVLWQRRQGDSSNGWLAWRPLDQAVPELPPLDAVIVLSGVTPGADCDMSLNTDLALAGLDVARQAAARHVFLASSQAVYGAQDGPLTEATPMRPGNAYGQAKADMERAAKAWQDAQGPDAPGITCLRIGNVAGADMLGKAVASGGALRLDRFADGAGPERAYIGAGGFARVLESLLGAVAAGKPLPFALNVAAPQPVRMSELLTAWGRTWDWAAAPDTARQSILLDVAALCRLHAFAPSDRDAAVMVDEWERLGRE